MVFVMTQPKREPTTYRKRGGYANHYVTPTRCVFIYIITFPKLIWVKPFRRYMMKKLTPNTYNWRVSV